MSAIQQILSGYGAITDPNYADVLALLHFDGADGSTTFTDQKGNTWAAQGNAQLDTAQSKFGGASLLCDGTGDYTNSTIAALPFANTFTIEGWARINSFAADMGFLFFGNVNSNDNRVQIDIRSDGSMAFFSAAGAGDDRWNVVASSATVTTGVWYHIAGVKNGASAVLYVDGNSVASTGSAGTTPSHGTTANIGTARRAGAQRFLNGWIDDVRFTNNVARYTGNFSPPTAAFPNS